MNYSRQADVYDAHERKDIVNIIGAGATGSWVALILAKLGVYSVEIKDFDIIEEHNVPNQLYGTNMIGVYKTAGITKLIGQLVDPEYTKLHVVIDNVKIENTPGVLYSLANTTVFNLVDSMKARTDILEECLKAKANTLIETRMGLTGYRIYMVDLTNDEEVAKYRETLYSDEDAETSACGTSQSVVSTAMQCASHAVNLWLAKLNGMENIPNEIIMDAHSSLMMQRRFIKENN